MREGLAGGRRVQRDSPRRRDPQGRASRQAEEQAVEAGVHGVGGQRRPWSLVRPGGAGGPQQARARVRHYLQNLPGDEEGLSQRSNWVPSEHVFFPDILLQKGKHAGSCRDFIAKVNVPSNSDRTVLLPSVCSLTPTHLSTHLPSHFSSFAKFQGKNTHPRSSLVA